MPTNPRPKGLPKRIPDWAWKWLKWRSSKPKPAPTPPPTPKPPAPTPPPPKPKPEPKPPAQPITMYDSVTLSALPKGAEAYAGYVGGHWPTYPKLPPAKYKLSIAVTASENARCLDVEPGDATPDQAAAWVKKQKARGEKMPVVYTSAAYGQSLVNKLDASGLRYGKDYMWWSAHYTGVKHLCGPGCGFGLKVRAHATQFTDKALGRNLDESICSPGFFS